MERYSFYKRINLAKRSHRLSGLGVILLILAGILIWLCISSSPEFSSPPATSSPSMNSIFLSGEPRAFDANKSMFSLWEFRPDDTVRCIRVDTDSEDRVRKINFNGPWMHSSQELIDVDVYSGELIEYSFKEKEYKENNWELPTFTVSSSDYVCALEVLIDSPPYLHKLSTDTGEPYRLISIGSDPQSYYDQDIIAIAIPIASNITDIYDYKPYRHITLHGKWDIFYYDRTDIDGHVSIHIKYEPQGVISSLDWSMVMDAR